MRKTASILLCALLSAGCTPAYVTAYQDQQKPDTYLRCNDRYNATICKLEGVQTYCTPKHFSQEQSCYDYVSKGHRAIQLPVQ